MNRLGGMVSLIVLTVAAVVHVAPASAAPPAQVTFVAHMVRGCPQSDSCTFTASGAITDSGTVNTTLLHAGALNSRVTGTAQYLRTFVGEQGTITIRLQTRLEMTSVPWVAEETAVWIVVDATGAYAGLRGQGTGTGARDFLAQSLDATYNGQVQLP